MRLRPDPLSRLRRGAAGHVLLPHEGILPIVSCQVAAIQTFGDRINLHVHLHFLVTEGGVDEAAFRLYS